MEAASTALIRLGDPRAVDQHAALDDRLAGFVGVYAVATLEAHRRQGHAAAVTAAALADAPTLPVVLGRHRRAQKCMALPARAGAQPAFLDDVRRLR